MKRSGRRTRGVHKLPIEQGNEVITQNGVVGRVSRIDGNKVYLINIGFEKEVEFEKNNLRRTDDVSEVPKKN
jgi:preprotein translocase subunit YajC